MSSGAGLAAAPLQLSVIVGSVESTRSIGRCMEALRVACCDLEYEVIVVEAGRDQATVTAVDAVPGARLISLDREALTPHLWAEGLAASRGRIVALTTGHCFVDCDWATSMISAIESGASAVGGPLRLEPDASTLDAAIFFLRYSAYLEGAANGVTADIAGDNAAYLRAEIPPASWDRGTGFWEIDVNREMRCQGGVLVWTNAAVAEFGHSFALGSICRHRFEHGKLFGAARLDRGETRPRLVLASPVVPAVILKRIWSRVWRRSEYRGRFFAAIPLIMLLASAWAAGEAAGALTGSRAHRS